MTALTSGPPHAARALNRWTRVVQAVGATVVAEGRAEMPCPAHGGTKPSGLAISVGDESDYPVLRCRTEHCDYAHVRNALIRLGAPADALVPGKGQGGGLHPATPRPAAAASARSPHLRPAAVLPTNEQVEAWEAALWAEDFMRKVLCRKWRITEDVLGATEAGYDRTRDAVTLPVREGEALVQVIYRDLSDSAPAARKSTTHPGVTGSHVYAPFGLAPGPVLLCAGEKDAFAAHAAGWNAVTFTHGEGAVPTPDRLAALAGRQVVVAYDNDAAGRRGAAKVAAALAEQGCAVRLADLAHVPDLPDKGDVFDVLQMDGGEELLRSALDRAEPWEGGSEEARQYDDEYEEVLKAVRAEFLVNLESSRDHLDDLLDDDGIAALPPVDYLVDGWVPRGGYSVLYGEPGVGKTLALIGMARAVRRGTRWQDNATKQGGVIYYQGEGLAQFKDRIAAWEARYPLRNDQRMAAWGTTDRVVDLTTPKASRRSSARCRASAGRRTSR